MVAHDGCENGRLTLAEQNLLRRLNIHDIHLGIRSHNISIRAISNSILRLDGEHVVTPPRTGSPPQSASPNIRVLSYKSKQVLDSSFAISVHGTSKFTDKSDLLVVTKPGCCGLKAFTANGLGNAG